MDKQELDQKETLSLDEAAHLLVTESLSIHDAETKLIRAIEHGKLQANIKRWSTEQWDDEKLPGNIDARETLITRTDFEAWQMSNAAA